MDELISRKAVIEAVDKNTKEVNGEVVLTDDITCILEELPTISQTDYANYEAFGWCKGCKEYDQEKHCCHRYSSFIRESLQDNINAVLEDIKEEMEKEQDECPYPLDIEHAIAIIEKHISGKQL